MELLTAADGGGGQPSDSAARPTAPHTVRKPDDGCVSPLVRPLTLRQHPGILLTNLSLEEEERTKECWSDVVGYMTCRCLRQAQTPRASARQDEDAAED